MKNSHIEWTDHTFNPWEGCTKVSPGCMHCYAETRNKRFGGGEAPNWGKGAPRRRTSASNWNQVKRWNKEAGLADAAHWPPSVPYDRPRVFCASLADWLDDEVPVEWLADLLTLIRECQHLDFLLLTKRPEKWAERLRVVAQLFNERSFGGLQHDEDLRRICMWVKLWLFGQAPKNIWIGTTVEDQVRADQRIPELLSIPARVRFLSCEPLLGYVNLKLTSRSFGFPQHITAQGHAVGMPQGIHWVICGGESGSAARPMHPDWACSLRDQCAVAGMPFLFKQWGEWLPVNQSIVGSKIGPSDYFPEARSTVIQLDGCQEFAFPKGAMTCLKVGKKSAGRLLDGEEHNEFPEVKP